MRTIILMILTVIYSMTVYSQSFTRFDESEGTTGVERLSITLKGKKKVYYTGGYGIGLVVDNQGFYKRAYSNLSKVFKNLTPEELEIFERIRIFLCISKQFKADYVEFIFDRKDRAYVLQNEELFYKWAKSFENMNEYKAFFEREETNPGMYVSFWVKYLFKEKYK